MGRRRRGRPHLPEPVRRADRDRAGPHVRPAAAGTLAPGADADIVVFNPDAERTLSASTHHMRVDYSCYEGRTVRGLPEVVMQRGNVLVRDGKFLGQRGAGRFLERSRFGPG